MEKFNEINVKLLKEQVYEYLKKQILKQNLQPGSAINMDSTSKMLGISKTPLRDALIQLEMEGFVTIKPRRGIYVNTLTLEDIKEYYHIIGALETKAIQLAFSLFTKEYISRMQKYNNEMTKAIKKRDFDFFYKNNIDFHSVYIDLTGNKTLIRIVDNLKKRLYDFPQRKELIIEWEERSIVEHQQIVDAIAAKDIEKAVYALHKLHWDFDRHEVYIRKYYFPAK